MTFDEVAAALDKCLVRIDGFVSMLWAWSNGTADGGAADDGRYPLPTGAATTTLVPCPARILADSSRLRIVRRVAVNSVIALSPSDDGLTIVCAGGGSSPATQSITVQVPGNVAPGWCVILVQEGTGGPRVTVSVPANADGTQGSLLAFGNVFRLAGENAEAVVKCLGRDSQNRSKMLLSGNILQ